MYFPQREEEGEPVNENDSNNMEERFYIEYRMIELITFLFLN